MLFTILSSVLFALAIPNELFPYGNPLYGFCGLAPFLAAVAAARNWKEAARLGALFGLVNSVLTYFWLVFFLDFSAWTISGVTVAHIFFFWILGPFLNHINRAGTQWRPFLVSAVWIVYEYIKSIGFLGFPWGLSAYPVNMILPLIQTADILGIWGIGYIIVLCNALIGQWIGKVVFTPLCFPAANQWAVFAALTAASLLYGGAALARDMPAAKHAIIVLVQQNTDSWAAGNDQNGLLVSQRLTRQAVSKRGGDVDLIVWSESSFRRPYIESRRYFSRTPKEDPFIPFLAEIGKPLLVGGPVYRNRESGEMYNAAILIDSAGNPIDFYAKQHPVPIAERIPFRKNRLVEAFFTKGVGLDAVGWTPGERFTVFSVPISAYGGPESALSFGAPICFEDAFAGLCRKYYNEGAEVLINLTNDSWSRTVSAQTQHFAASRFRAVENRRVLVRSTNSGVSAVVDPAGRMLETLPFFVEEARAVDIPVYDPGRPTAYALYGDILPLLCGIILFIVLVTMRLKRKKIPGPIFGPGIYASSG